MLHLSRQLARRGPPRARLSLQSRVLSRAFSSPAPLPLTGVRVLDLTRVLAGPYCTMLLGDLGAEVIKIENPHGGDDTRQWGPPFFDPAAPGPLTSAVAAEKVQQSDPWDIDSLRAPSPSATTTAPPTSAAAAADPAYRGEAAYFLALNRNKRSLAVDLKSPEGKAIILALARESDVVVENYVPGKLDALGLGHAALSTVNPGLVYASISGYGATGPMKEVPGYDVMASSLGGLLSVTGAPEAPARPGAALTDVITGLNTLSAILAALYTQRTRRLTSALAAAEAATAAAEAVAAEAEAAAAAAAADAAAVRAAVAAGLPLPPPPPLTMARAKTSNLAAAPTTTAAASEREGYHIIDGIPQSPLSGVSVSAVPAGDGWRLETSLLECQVAALANIAQAYLAAGVVSVRRGTQHGSIVPYQCFPIPSSPASSNESTGSKGDSAESKGVSAASPPSPSDAVPTPPRFLAVGALNDHQFRTLISPSCLDLPSLASDPRFMTNPLRVRNQAALLPLLTARLQALPPSDTLRLLARAGVPAAPVLAVDEALQHPQTLGRGMVQFVGYPQGSADVAAQAKEASNNNNSSINSSVPVLPLLGPAVKLFVPSTAASPRPTAQDTAPSASPLGVGAREGEEALDLRARLPPPFLGQHTRTVLRDVLGWDKGKIDALLDNKVVVQHTRWTE